MIPGFSNGPLGNATKYRLQVNSSVEYGPNTTVAFTAVLYTDEALVNDDYRIDWSENTPLQQRLEVSSND